MMTRVTRAQFLRGDWREPPVAPSPDAIALIRPTCLTIQGIFCNTCDEICESDAIRFVPAVGRPPAPTINEDTCTGCGECLGICPVDALDLKQRL